MRPRISPLLAQRLIETNLVALARIVPLTTADYRATIEMMSRLGLSGGTIYDALIATVARRLSVDNLLTLNPDDFRRVWPEGKHVISTP